MKGNFLQSKATMTEPGEWPGACGDQEAVVQTKDGVSHRCSAGSGHGAGGGAVCYFA
jgi:hypothetical protein